MQDILLHGFKNLRVMSGVDAYQENIRQYFPDDHIQTKALKIYSLIIPLFVRVLFCSSFAFWRWLCFI